MSGIHCEMHVAHLCVKRENDYPNGPIRIDRPRNEENWWDITLAVFVQDEKPIGVMVKEIRKSP